MPVSAPTEHSLDAIAAAAVGAPRLLLRSGPIDCLADMHLQRSQPHTWAAFAHYLQTTPARHILLLGDVFEVWVGDDVLQEAGSFEAEVAALLRQVSRSKALYLMHGNRDFMIGQAFAQATGVQLLADPTVLEVDFNDADVADAQRAQGLTGRWLLSHGDALCTDDLPYQQFRATSRNSAWQQHFLAQPLEARRLLATSVRSESTQRKAGQTQAEYVDLNAEATRTWLRASGCTTLIHGHTHRSAVLDLGAGLSRIVVSDWDMHASPPRLEVLRIAPGHAREVSCQRLALAELGLPGNRQSV